MTVPVTRVVLRVLARADTADQLRPCCSIWPRPRAGRNLGTFKTRRAAERHERAVQFFKRGG